MKSCTLAALLAVTLGVLATPPDARSNHWSSSRVVYAPSYYCPPPVYSYTPPVYHSPPVYHRPMYHPAPAYVRPARPVVEVGAYDKVGFKPKSITVEPGTTVRWVNHGQERHTVTSRNGLFDSGELSPGASYSVTFTRPGTYHYFCRPHEKMGMVGTVVVGSGGNGGGSGYSGSGY